MREILTAAISICLIVFAGGSLQAEEKETPTTTNPEEVIEKKTPEKKEPMSAFHFESADGWKKADWSDRIQLTATGDDQTEGKQAMRVKMSQPETGKIALNAKLPNLDLDKYEAFVIDVKLEAEKNYPSLLTMALLLGKNALWVESRPVQLKKGWNKDIRFDLGSSDWKSAGSSWHHQTSPRRQGDAWSLTLLIHGLDFDEAVLLDNLRLTPAKEAVAKIEAQKRETDDLTRADRIRAYTLNMLGQYAADLHSQNQPDAASALQTVITEAAAAPLTPRAMPLAPLTIMIARNGHVRIEDKVVMPAKVAETLKALAKEDRTVIISTDPSAPFNAVTSVLEASKQAGFKDVKISRNK